MYFHATIHARYVSSPDKRDQTSVSSIISQGLVDRPQANLAPYDMIQRSIAFSFWRRATAPSHKDLVGYLKHPGCTQAEQRFSSRATRRRQSCDHDAPFKLFAEGIQTGDRSRPSTLRIFSFFPGADETATYYCACLLRSRPAVDPTSILRPPRTAIAAELARQNGDR